MSHFAATVRPSCGVNLSLNRVCVFCVINSHMLIKKPHEILDTSLSPFFVVTVSLSTLLNGYMRLHLYATMQLSVAIVAHLHQSPDTFYDVGGNACSEFTVPKCTTLN